MAIGEDEVIVFARFEVPKDEGPIIVVFFPILEPPESNHKLQMAQTQNGQKSIKKFEKYDIYMQRKHQITRIKPINKDLSHSSGINGGEVEEGESGEGWWQQGVQKEACSVER